MRVDPFKGVGVRTSSGWGIGISVGGAEKMVSNQNGQDLEVFYLGMSSRNTFRRK